MKIYFCAGGMGTDREELLTLLEVSQLHSYYAVICKEQRFGAKEDFNYIIDKMKDKTK